MSPVQSNFKSVIVIGTPACKRIAGFNSALMKTGLPEARFVSYQQLYEAEPGYLRSLLLKEAEGGAVLLRLESPGRHVETENLLLQLGAKFVDFADNRESQKGLLRNQRQWYHGWCEVLDRIEFEWKGVQNITCMNFAPDIKVMFDKGVCSKRLFSNGIRVPAALGIIQSYEDLLMQMEKFKISRVFLKIAHGSSGSGVVAYRHNTLRREAITTVETDGTDLYNSRRIKSYSEVTTIRKLIDALAKHHLWAEEWLPKATLSSGVCDLRVVVINGKAHHVVVRSSKNTITNLHLLNARSDVSVLKSKMPRAAWNAMIESCEQTMKLAFPNSFYAGIDVAVSPTFTKHAVLEVNAFGDQLNNCSFNGKDTYATELSELLSLPGASGGLLNAVHA